MQRRVVTWIGVAALAGAAGVAIQARRGSSNPTGDQAWVSFEPMPRVVPASQMREIRERGRSQLGFDPAEMP